MVDLFLIKYALFNGKEGPPLIIYDYTIILSENEENPRIFVKR